MQLSGVGPIKFFPGLILTPPDVYFAPALVTVLHVAPGFEPLIVIFLMIGKSHFVPVEIRPLQHVLILDRPGTLPDALDAVRHLA